MRPKEGTSLHLRVDPATVHLFDAASGDAI
jgi:hypothetical protein